MYNSTNGISMDAEMETLSSDIPCHFSFKGSCSELLETRQSQKYLQQIKAYSALI